MLFGFPDEVGRMLLNRGPLYIDGDNRLYDEKKQFIDYYFNLNKRNISQSSASKREIEMVNRTNSNSAQINTQKTVDN